jgi:Holliday junction resolvase RusA-like endonuclease
MIAFHIPGEPVAFARSGGKGVVRFTPKRQRDFMALVQLAASKAMADQEPFAGPVEMVVRAVYLVPRSWPKRKADAAKWRISKPDSDNIGKIIADAMNTIVFADDAQVASLTVQKMYGPLAGVTVSVSTLDPEGRL